MSAFRTLFAAGTVTYVALTSAALMSLAPALACQPPPRNNPPAGPAPCDSVVDCAADETCSNGKCAKSTGEGEGEGTVDEAQAVAAYCAKQSSCVVATPACVEETSTNLTAVRAGKQQAACAQAAIELDDVFACIGGASATCSVFTDVDGVAQDCPQIETALHDLGVCEGVSGIGGEGEGEGEGGPIGEGEGAPAGEGEGEGAPSPCASLPGFTAATSPTLTLQSVTATYNGDQGCDTTFSISALITVTGSVFSATSATVSVDGATTAAVSQVFPATQNQLGLTACSTARLFFFAVQVTAADGTTNVVCTIPN